MYLFVLSGVHGEETRSLSVCRGCSLMCFLH